MYILYASNIYVSYIMSEMYSIRNVYCMHFGFLVSSKIRNVYNIQYENIRIVYYIHNVYIQTL